VEQTALGSPSRGERGGGPDCCGQYSMTVRRVTALLATGCLLATGSAAVVQSTTATAVAAAGPCGTASVPRAHYRHVVVVMYENKHLADVIGSPDAPYATALAKACGYATKYADAGSQFNSLPNYIALTSGRSNTPIQTDCSPSPSCS